MKRQAKYLNMIYCFIALISGFIYFFRLSSNTKIYIKGILTSNPSQFNNILFHLIIIISLFILSLLLLGVIFNYIYVFFEFFTIGFSFASYFYIYHFNGLAFGFIYNIVTKLIYLILLYFLFTKYYKISKYNYLYVIKHEKVMNYWRPFIQSFMIILLIITNDIVITLFLNRIMDLFKFIL